MVFPGKPRTGGNVVTGSFLVPSFLFSFVALFDDAGHPEGDKQAGRHKMHFSPWVLDTGFLMKILVWLIFHALCVWSWTPWQWGHPHAYTEDGKNEGVKPCWSTFLIDKIGNDLNQWLSKLFSTDRNNSFFSTLFPSDAFFLWSSDTICVPGFVEL